MTIDELRELLCGGELVYATCNKSRCNVRCINENNTIAIGIHGVSVYRRNESVTIDQLSDITHNITPTLGYIPRD